MRCKDHLSRPADFCINTVPGVTLADYAAGLDANEVAEGMHALSFGCYQRLSSDIASDPAVASYFYLRRYHCR